MKRILALVFLLVPFGLFAQENIYGTYLSDRGAIMIRPVTDEGDFFLYYSIQQDEGEIEYKNMAVCKINRINKKLIELNSIEARSSLFNGLTVKKRKSYLSLDTLYIYFDIPYNMNELEINIYLNSLEKEDLNEFIFSEKNRVFKLPLVKNNIYEFFKHNKVLIDKFYPIYKYTNLNGISDISDYRIKYARVSIDVNLEEMENFIEIKIPALTNNYFDRYYIEGEYAEIRENTIIWKGITFTKTSQEFQSSLLLHTHYYNSLVF